MKVGPFSTGAVHHVEALHALASLPDDSIDMLLTDPPYSSGGRTIAERQRDPLDKYPKRALGRSTFSGDARDQRSWGFWATLWLTEAFRALKPGGYALIFTDWRQLPAATDALQAGGFTWRGVVAWDKGESARPPHSGYFRHQAEFLAWGTKGAFPAKKLGPFPGVFRVTLPRTEKQHVVAKPLDLMRKLVRAVPEGAVVLDPFAGSGTTVVACRMEKRHGIGFESVDEHVATSTRRLETVGA